MRLIDFFSLPTYPLTLQKLTKKSFYEMGNLSNAQQKLLQEQIDSIKITAHLTPDKTNIPVFQSEKHEYLEIFVIEVDLKSNQAWSDLPTKQNKAMHELFHRAIPYPLVLMVYSGNMTQLSLAEKFINQADISSEKLIINEVFQTDWINPISPLNYQQEFLNSLRYDKLNKQNLYTLYQSLIQRFTALLIAEKTGLFSLPAQTPKTSQTEIDQQRQELRTILRLDREISELTNKIKDCTQFNEKVQLNLQLQTLKKELNNLKTG